MTYSDFEKLAKLDVKDAWQKWKESEENPEHFKPLMQQFKPLLTSYKNKYSRNAAVPASAVEAQVHKQFLLGCRSWEPEKSQLLTHVSNYMKGVDRFVGDYLNTGHIPEPRRLMINHYVNSRDSLHEEFGKAPSYEEIAKHMNEQYAAAQKITRVKPTDLVKLDKELARKDMTEEMSLDEPEHWKSPVEQQAIIMMHYSTPIEPNKKHPFRLTQDEFEIFKRVHPLTEEGTLDYENAKKFKDIATELKFSAPKISRSLKNINKKIRTATQYV